MKSSTVTLLLGIVLLTLPYLAALGTTIDPRHCAHLLRVGILIGVKPCKPNQCHTGCAPLTLPVPKVASHPPKPKGTIHKRALHTPVPDVPRRRW